MNRSRVLLPTAIFCLLISGAAGLVYQVAWMRYLSLFLGHTSYAVVAVLVAFMGGLALGNAWLGARADQVQRPLALYARLEIGIAVYALFFPFYYEWCDEAYVGLARSWQPSGAGLLGLKFGFSLLTILLPTVLMGGTLPVMTRLVTRSLGELQERVSTLYFINSLGAVVGCFLADFWWIPAIGLPGTVLAGAALNFVVGAFALFMSGWIKEGQGKAYGSGSNQKGSSEEMNQMFTPREIKLAVIGIGISGFVAMLYEVVWTRMLALALGSSTHAFSLMLITFITGIAVGAWLVGRWKGLRRTLDAFGWAELALAVTLLVSMFFYERVPYWFTRLADMLVRRPEVYPLYEFVQSLVCFAVMFVPTICLGMTLPLVSRIATAELARTGRSVGWVFSVNTLGTVLGAAVTGLWLLPWLGLARTLALGIALNAGIAAFVLGRNRPTGGRFFAVFVPLASVAFVIGVGVLFADTWRRAFTMGLWRGTVSSPQMYRSSILAVKHAYYRDGAGSTVSVDRTMAGGKEHLSLRVNGKPEAGTMNDVVTQLLLGHIPMFLRLDAKQALVIGLGSGMTGGAVMRHPQVEHLDVVEISPEVVQAARLFAAHNGGILDNPRARVVVEDARSFLRTTDRKYDVIISEPSNPWMAGVAAVFSLEYYEHCGAHLNRGGVMAQWVQKYEFDDGALQIVIRTFGQAFPFFSVWEIASGDLMLVGSNEPLSVDFRAMEERINQPEVKADLARIDLFRLPVLLAQETISPENAPFIADPSVPAHSDFYPVLEYAAQRAFFVRGSTEIQLRFAENRSPRPGTLLGRYLQEHALTETDFKAFALFQTTHRIFEPALFHSLLKGWQNNNPQSILPIELSAKAQERETALEFQAVRLAMKRDVIFQDAAKDPELLRHYARLLAQTYVSQRSVFYLPSATELESALQRLIETDKPNQRIYKLRLAGLAWDRKDDEACLRMAQSGFDRDLKSGGPINFDLDPQAPTRILARMMDIYLRRGNVGEAWKLCQQARSWGYIGTAGPSSDPLLEMTYRKVEAQQAVAQANPRRTAP
jgi:predicted membrane-bound spermidine synthase